MCQIGWFLLSVREVAAAHWCFHDLFVQVEANPIRVILGTAEGQGGYRRGRLYKGALPAPICRIEARVWEHVKAFLSPLPHVPSAFIPLERYIWHR